MATTFDLPTSWPALASAVRHASDERLVALVQEGSDDAFSEIVRRHERDIRVACARRVGNDHAADVAQQAFLQAMLALRRDSGPSADVGLRPWLFTIARNCCIDFLRAQGPEMVELSATIDGVAQPPQLAEERDRLRRTVRMMGLLPGDQRRALVARELEGRSYEEISAELGTTGGSVRQMIFRARDSVRRGVLTLLPLPRVLWFLRSNSEPAAVLFGRSAEPLAGCIALALISCAPLVATVMPDSERQRDADRGRAAAHAAPAASAAALSGAQAAPATTLVVTRSEAGTPAQAPAVQSRGTRRGGLTPVAKIERVRIGASLPDAGGLTPVAPAAAAVTPAPATPAEAPAATAQTQPEAVAVSQPVADPAPEPVKQPGKSAAPEPTAPAVDSGPPSRSNGNGKGQGGGHRSDDVAVAPAPVVAPTAPSAGAPPRWNNGNGKGYGRGHRSVTAPEPVVAPAPVAAPEPEPVVAPAPEVASEPEPAKASPGLPWTQGNGGGKGRGRGRS